MSSGLDRGPTYTTLLVRLIAADDRDWVAATLVRDWTSTSVARLGELVDAADLPGYVATASGHRVGVLLVDVKDRDVEVVSVSTSEPRRGVGRALMVRCFDEARATGCRRVWLVTTNDNVAAIAFYQRIGMDLRALHRHAVRASRRLKPTIPDRDAAGVRIEHELEFELLIDTCLSDSEDAT